MNVIQDIINEVMIETNNAIKELLNYAGVPTENEKKIKELMDSHNVKLFSIHVGKEPLDHDYIFIVKKKDEVVAGFRITLSLIENKIKKIFFTRDSKELKNLLRKIGGYLK